MDGRSDGYVRPREIEPKETNVGDDKNISYLLACVSKCNVTYGVICLNSGVELELKEMKGVECIFFAFLGKPNKKNYHHYTI